MNKNSLLKVFCVAAALLGCLLYIASRFVYGVGFLMLICALLCFFTAFFAALFLPYKNRSMQKTAKILKTLCTIAFIFGLISFVFVESLIVSGWPSGGPESADVVIILGAGLRGETMSLVLHSRMELAAEFLRENPDCLAVVSGGQGPGESITEALAMKRYLETQGVAETRIIMEDKSTNTEENLRFSLEILSENEVAGCRIAVLSNSFHLYRAKQLAAAQGVDVQTIGAAMPRHGLVPLNSYVREYFSIMNMVVKNILKMGG